MTPAGRLAPLFPALVIAMAAACAAAAVVTRSPLWLIAMIAAVYGLPLVAFRAINAIRPVREGLSRLDEPRYSPWWTSHQLQRIFIAIPQLESLLQLIPGAFSLWLRMWGSDVGKRVHWTPRVEIADRSLMVVGDDVVFGHKVECFAHAIKPSNERIVLYVRKITIGRGAFLGAGVRIGPGVRIDEGAFVPTLTDLYMHAVVTADETPAEVRPS